MSRSHDLIVTPDAGDAGATAGWATLGERRWRCILGRGGVRRDKQEGDGATPVGRFALRRLLYRADRLARPAGTLPVAALDPADGWCDDPADAAYNRAVALPYPASCETLWRNDGVYDLIVVTGHNDAPPLAGAGSAIFIHVARDDRAPTAGCIAFAMADLLEILAALAPGSAVAVAPGGS